MSELEFTENDLWMSKKFDPMMAELIVEYSAQGKTDKEIANIIGVNKCTIYRWKARFGALSDSSKAAKGLANDKVKVSLYQRCLGYDYEEERAFYDKERGEVIKCKIQRHAPPDIGAIAMWLKARDPENWKEVQLDASKEQAYPALSD